MSQTLPHESRTPAAPQPIVNISCYKFVPLDDLESRRAAIRECATRLGLRGTVLLSHEGINLFVAGRRDSVAEFVAELTSDPLLADLQPKESLSDYQPFNRMLVKIKREIIAFGVPSIDPGTRTSPKLSARELKQWLDEGRRVRLLDVRNEYECEIGTFDNAIRLGLDHFREFPDAVRRLPEELRAEPVVMFCTGGIRCEKAGPLMEHAGFEHVYQLDGGILKYFEEVGGDHYHGECFVFDQRVAVDAALRETDTTQCYVCQAVVTPEQQQSPSYVPGRSCPACAVPAEVQLRNRLAARESRLAELATPLPGSVPYLNRRPLNVPERFDGMMLVDFLSDWHPQVCRGEWQQRIDAGRIVPVASRRRRRAESPTAPLAAEDRVRAGQRLWHLQPGHREPDVAADVRFLYEDEHLIVLSKPAPLPMHASGRFQRNTLRHLLNEVYFPERPHLVHRLDANTSGVVVLCRKKRIAAQVQPQFEDRSVSKTYLARVIGHPQSSEFTCRLPISRTPGPGGIRLPDPDGDPAVTRFEVQERLPDGTTILRVHPVTGRTNQIRAHLWALEIPLLGDPAYRVHGELGTNRTLLPSEPPMCLHAASVTFRDPSGVDRTFEAPRPHWMPST